MISVMEEECWLMRAFSLELEDVEEEDEEEAEDEPADEAELVEKEAPELI